MAIFTLVPKAASVPAFVSPEEKIKRLLTAALIRGGVRFTWLDSRTVDLIMNGRLVSANVGEVVRSWHLAPTQRRPEVIERWVEATLNYPQWEERRRELGQSFEQAGSRLLLRLQPAGLAQPDHALVRSYAPGIDMSVFVDVDRPANGLGRARSALSVAELANWGAADADVLATAHANTRRVIEPWHVGVQILHREARVSLVVCEDSRGASPALFLPELLPSPAPHGVLLAVPQHDTVMIHLVTDRERTGEAVPWMVGRAGRMFAAMPHPVSPELYWWHDGEITLIEVDRRTENWAIRPDPHFDAMFADLPPRADA